MNWEEKIKEFEAEHHHHWANIVRAAKAYMDAHHAARSHPLAFSSAVHPMSDEYPEYKAVNIAYQKAYSDLWMATDVEYDEDGFRNLIWEWRYWKVMARKCCFYQKSMLTSHLAGKTMRNLQDAESKMMTACGLDNYKPRATILRKHFQNLKSKS
jgi:hypothetical protein